MGNRPFAPPNTPTPATPAKALAADLSYKYRLPVSDVEHLASALASTKAESSHVSLVEKFITPMLPASLPVASGGAFLRRSFPSVVFPPPPAEASPTSRAVHYLTRLVHVYSMLSRPSRKPHPSLDASTCSILELLWLCACSDPEGENPTECVTAFFEPEVSRQLKLSYEAFAKESSPVPDLSQPSSLPENLTHQPGPASKLPSTTQSFLSWVDVCYPTLHYAVSKHFALPLLPRYHNCAAPAPSLPSPMPPLHTLLRLSFQFAPLFSASDPWHVLFDTNEDGASFNRYRLCTLGYSSPTLTIITVQTSSGCFDIGAYTAAVPSDSGKFHKSPSTAFLFTTYPHFKTYIAVPGSENSVFVNSASRSKNLDALPRGVGWGGYVGSFRCFLSEEEVSGPVPDFAPQATTQLTPLELTLSS